MAASLEVGGEEGFQDFRSGLGIDEAAGHDDDVGVVVLAGQAGDFGYPAEGGADAVVVVERHVDAVSAAADGDAGVALAAFYGGGKGVGVVGIVATFGAAGAEVFIGPSFLVEPLLDELFQLVPGVVGGEPDDFVVHVFLWI